MYKYKFYIDIAHLHIVKKAINLETNGGGVDVRVLRRIFPATNAASRPSGVFKTTSIEDPDTSSHAYNKINYKCTHIQVCIYILKYISNTYNDAFQL